MAGLYFKIRRHFDVQFALGVIGRESEMSDQPTDQIKGQLGTVATVVWLGVGALAFVLDRGFGGLFSLQALLFLGVGMFLAAIVSGLVAYKLFLRLADRAAMAAGAEGARQAVLRAVIQAYAISGALTVILVVGIYLSFFKR